MMIMLVMGVCCCCALSSGGIVALYFMHDGFKEWVDENILKKDGDDEECEYEYVRRECSLGPGKCTLTDWKCPDGYEDTGNTWDTKGEKDASWNQPGGEGEKQCKKCK